MSLCLAILLPRHLQGHFWDIDYQCSSSATQSPKSNRPALRATDVWSEALITIDLLISCLPAFCEGRCTGPERAIGRIAGLRGWCI